MSKTHLGHYYGPAPSDAELGIGTTLVDRVIEVLPTLICADCDAVYDPAKRMVHADMCGGRFVSQ